MNLLQAWLSGFHRNNKERKISQIFYFYKSDEGIYSKLNLEQTSKTKKGDFELLIQQLW